ncbi:MAG: histidinol-phosphate transaminase [FCB group bacterium]|nr:histidinol-phosphate transaminase [FCB group bacterium]
MAIVPKHIKELAPYKPGKPASEILREFGLRKIIKLNSNENPGGPSPKAIDAARAALVNCHRYPDPAGYELKTKLCEKYDLERSNVVLGSGSEGIMSIIMRTFLAPDDEIIGARNSFIGFKVLANASGRRINWVPMDNYRYDLNALAGAINEYTKIIYLANPDNPTGSYFKRSEFETFIRQVPARVLVILDEAYFEFARSHADYPDSMMYRFDNVITLRTFSKAHGLAGFRVGYGFAHEELIGNLMKVRLPFEPALPSLAAAVAAMEDEQYLRRTLERNRVELERLEREFRGLGCRPLPSVTNFLTLVFDDGEKSRAFAEGLLQKGILVRHLAGFGWQDCVRITVGLAEDNTILLQAAEKVLQCL